MLRQAPFYAAIRAAVRKDMLGPVRIASLTEQLDVRHGGTFMRRWHAQSAHSGGLLRHKACHDLDIICWPPDGRRRSVSSFGGLDTFGGPPPAMLWAVRPPRNFARMSIRACMNGGPRGEADPAAYGRSLCVPHGQGHRRHQVVSFVLDSGARGTFHLAVQGPIRSERRITLIGDRARLDGIFEDGTFTITFTDSERPPFVWTADGRGRGSHGGGDRVTMLEFLNACAGRSPPPITSPEETIRGLVFALAAERARKSETVVQLQSSDFDLVS